MKTLVLIVAALVFIAAVTHATPVEEKPLDCPENEVYYKCSLEKCYKKCQNLKIPPPCPSIAAGCYMPSCECKENYLRNGQGICVPIGQCD